MTHPAQPQKSFPTADPAVYARSYDNTAYHKLSDQEKLEFPPSGNTHLLFCANRHIDKFAQAYHEGNSMPGILLKPEKPKSLIQEKIALFANQPQGAADVLGRMAKELGKKIRLAENYAQMFEHTDDYLRKVASVKRISTNQIMYNALKIIGQHPEQNIDEICRELRVSGRQLRRVFQEQVGMSPKYYLRIIRLHKAVALVMTADTIDFQQIIHECGYYDQSHFAKDIKLFTGKKPKEFFRQDN